jgi:hypothetical protein
MSRYGILSSGRVVSINVRLDIPVALGEVRLQVSKWPLIHVRCRGHSGNVSYGPKGGGFGHNGPPQLLLCPSFVGSNISIAITPITVLFSIRLIPFCMAAADII